MSNNFNNEKLNDLKKQILNLQENQYYEIIKILDKFEGKYSQNKNGIFINMNKLSDTIIEEIEKFLVFCKSNNKYLEKNDNKIKEYYNLINNK